MSGQASANARRFWRGRIRAEAERAAVATQWFPADLVVLRIAYFYVDAPAADLDNIVKPIQDALKGIAYDDDIQVIDLVASMRPKIASDVIRMSAALAAGFAGNSDFIYVRVEQSTVVEVLK